jgi:hypothetical protein
MPTTIIMPTLAFLIIFGVMFGLVLYLMLEMRKMKNKVPLSEVIKDFYPIVRKEMPKETEFYVEMSKREKMQLSDLN